MIALAALLLCLIPASAGAQAVVRVEADASVEGGAIRLGDIALFDGLSPDARARLAALSLGSAAAPGRARSFGGASLRERIAEQVPGAVIEVPDEIRVHTAYQEIAPEYVRARLEQAVRHRMPWPPEAVRFSAWRLPERFAVPVRARRFVVRFGESEDFLGRVTAEVEMIDPDGGESKPVRRTIAVDLDVRLPVVVTTERLRRGDEIRGGVLRLEARELRALPRGVLFEPDGILGRRVRSSLPAGTALQVSHLDDERIVRRGDQIVVHAGSDGLELRVEAKALQEGVLGETIRVENPATRRRFMVRVSGPGEARMSLAAVGAGR